MKDSVCTLFIIYLGLTGLSAVTRDAGSLKLLTVDDMKSLFA